MKGINVAIAAVVVAICALGWFSMASKTVSEANQHNAYIEQADTWVEEGLYQRAIGKYKLALAEEPAAGIYAKTIAAYQARVEEVADLEEILKETVAEYTEFLEEAVAACPQEEEFVRLLGQMYLDDENYTKAYSCLRAAVANGINSEEVLAMLRQARYAWNYRGSTYAAVLPPVGTTYTVARKDMWGIYDVKEGSLFSHEYVYASQSSADGVVVLSTTQDSRLVNGEGMVMGIFEKQAAAAGVYAEGLVAVSFDGNTYSYYNEFAREQFGGYEAAGMFQNGQAAVKQDGVWFLIDTTGKKVSDDYTRIVLGTGGEYMINGVMLAAKTDGSYSFYDEKMKVLASFDADEVDALTGDGIVAFSRGGKWGFVNKDGAVVVEPRYAMARSFSNGLAAVCEEDKWGFIDNGGLVAIDFQFADALYFDSQGVCAVRTDVPPMTYEEVIEETLGIPTEPDTEAVTEPVEEETAPAQTQAPEETVPGETQPEAAVGTDTETTGETAQEPVTEAPAEEPVYEEWNLLKLINGIVED